MPRPGVACTLGIRVSPREVALELEHVLREGVGGARVAPQRPQRVLVGARGAPHAEVDAAGVQGLQRPELLGDRQRRVVRQHDPARAEPDPFGVGGDVGDEHGRGRRGDRVDVVVLGVPDPAVAELLGPLGEPHARLQARPHGLAATDPGEVEDRQRQGGHGYDLSGLVQAAAALYGRSRATPRRRRAGPVNAGGAAWPASPRPWRRRARSARPPRRARRCTPRRG